MMLADKIIMLRKKNGWSQEELAERLNVSRQAVSKWEGNLSAPELDNLIAMSELFGVSTDYLLKDEFGDEEFDAAEETAQEEAQAADPEKGEEDDAEEEPEPIRFDPVRVIGREESERYFGEIGKMSWWIATGVLLCILSPVVLILLGGFADLAWVDENFAAGMGLLALFVFVAAALVLFIPSGMRLSKFEYLAKDNICLDEETKAFVNEKKNGYEMTHILLLTVGVLLCVAGVAQLVVISCLIPGALPTVISVCGLLALVAIGVFLIVRTCNVYEGYQKLLREGEYARDGKSPKSELISTIYWLAALAIYLGTSFLTGAWGLTWVIWPVAAVISPIIELIETKRNQR